MQATRHIRNFSIIAHIDHGKSTLADRMLEVTDTVPERKMRDQVLDEMELERERGITIKMTPVRMRHIHKGESYELNLIDTPGHIDFAYEVSRSLKAVEGALLLVDATQGVQAQTLSTLSLAREQGLVIIPVLSKIDAPHARPTEVALEVSTLLGISPETVLACSGKTGEGVPELLDHIVSQIPPPEESTALSNDFRGLVFDFEYSNHRGIIVYARVFDGAVAKGDKLVFCGSEEKFEVLEVGTFSPGPIATDTVSVGEIGYIVTGIKKPGVARVGDTLTRPQSSLPALPGYMTPAPVVWASVYPEAQDDFNELRQALDRLKLTDASLAFEEESSGVLGRGFRCGFLGMLHLEIVTERLRREFDLTLIVTMPSITYEVTLRDGKTETIYTPSKFPEHGTYTTVREPWVRASVIAPQDYVGTLMQILFDHEAEVGETEVFGDGRVRLSVAMPLRELMRNFFDELKSATAGYASISYELGDMREADVVRLDVLVAEEVVPAFSRVVSRRRVEHEAEKMVEKLYDILPKQLFVVKIQSRALGRIISSKTLSALKKDVTGHLYGGDITRKRKLWEKQKKGKKRMKSMGKVDIPQSVFLKMMRS